MPPREPGEQWIDAPGFEGLYLVSSLARVWSVPRYSLAPRTGMRRVGGRLRRANLGPNGYFQITLFRDGRKYRMSLHRLVLIAFRGEPAPGQIARHGPRGKSDNSLPNLQWGTYEENNGCDRVRDETELAGEKNHKARLTPAQVLAIRARYASGESQQELADAYGVGQCAIFNIVTCKTWKHVAGSPQRIGQVRGERQAGAKLTEAIVREVRARYDAGERVGKLAEEFGVNHMTVGRVVRRQAWKHVA